MINENLKKKNFKFLLFFDIFYRLPNLLTINPSLTNLTINKILLKILFYINVFNNNLDQVYRYLLNNYKNTISFITFNNNNYYYPLCYYFETKLIINEIFKFPLYLSNHINKLYLIQNFDIYLNKNKILKIIIVKIIILFLINLIQNFKNKKSKIND